MKGTAPAGSAVSVSARLVRAAAPGFMVKTAAGVAVAVPSLAAGTVVAATATAGSDGTFSAALVLAPGSWEIGARPAPAAASSPAASPAASALPSAAETTGPAGPSVTVTVTPPAGLTGMLSVAGGPSYLLVLQDDVPLSGVSGHTFAAGKTVPLSAKRTLVVRAGNAGAVTMTINGVVIGKMGTAGQVVEWHIVAGG